MKNIILIFLIIGFPFKRNETENLIGTYHSENNKFERLFVMQLNENDKFIYSYSLGGCQGEITGTYIVSNNRIKFSNDKEFLDDAKNSEFGKPIYPNLSLIEWKIKGNYIKPQSKINCGCFVENGKHIKQ
jgi:hypothetical protein